MPRSGDVDEPAGGWLYQGLKDGTPGGQYLSVTFPDGRTLGLGNVSGASGSETNGEGGGQ